LRYFELKKTSVGFNPKQTVQKKELSAIKYL
jgi:hypothetical protein